jgi:hypothetical protein
MEWVWNRWKRSRQYHGAKLLRRVTCGTTTTANDYLTQGHRAHRPNPFRSVPDPANAEDKNEQFPASTRPVLKPQRMYRANAIFVVAFAEPRAGDVHISEPCTRPDRTPDYARLTFPTNRYFDKSSHRVNCMSLVENKLASSVSDITWVVTGFKYFM